MVEDNLFQRHLNVANVLFVVLDVAGNVMQTNRYTASLLGYDEQEMLGKNWFETFVPAKNRDQVRKVWSQVVSGEIESVGDYENPVVTRSGEERIIAWHNSAMYDEDGRFVSHVSSGSDITEKVKVERELRWSQRRLNQAQAAGNVGAWDWNPQNGELVWSDEVFHILGFDVDAVKPSYELFLDCVHPDDRDGLNRQVESSLQQNSPYNIDCRIIQNSGAEILVNAQGQVYFDQDMNAVQMLGTFQDITQRKLVEQKVIESQRALADAQALAHLGSWEWNIQDGSEIWSDEQFRIFGYEPGEVEPTYQLFVDALHPQDKASVLRAVQDAKDGDDSFALEYRIIRPDHEERTVHAKAVASRDSDGNLVKMMGTVLDITERKQSAEKIHQLETQFYQAQKMEALGTLVGGIAHDFNNTLAGITGSVFLAREEHPEAPSTLIEYLDSIETLSIRAAKMIEQLLGFARKSNTEMEPVSIAGLIKEVIRLHAVSLPVNITLLHEMAGVDASIMGDSSLLQQALVNLINNARDAVEGVENPKIKIDARLFGADDAFLEQHPGARGREFVCICVSDNGAGISDEIKMHLFEPFFTTKEAGKGTGLGLAMVYGTVQTHHGFIEVENRIGGGSRFSLYFPHIEDEKAGSENLKAEPVLQTGRGETVLIVDDEPMVVDVGARILKRLNYQVLTAIDGREAVDIYKAEGSNIALVILDVLMPVMDGIEAAAAIRGIDPEARIMFATGYDHSGALSVSDGLVAETVIDKPFKILEFSRIVRNVLDR